MLVGEIQGERVADSEVSLSLESSHGAVGRASLHVVDGEQNPNSILVYCLLLLIPRSQQLQLDIVLYCFFSQSCRLQ